MSCKTNKPLREYATLWERTSDLQARLAACQATGEVADKRFFDGLSGQEDLSLLYEGHDFAQTDVA